jgi:hypothetical protein
MFRPVGGVPGTGKTYYIMNLLTTEFFEWNKSLDRWDYKKDKNGNDIVVTFFSNIDGLKLPHINIDQYFIRENITFRDFFTNEYFKAHTEEFGKTVILLDECNRYFPTDFKDDKDLLPGTKEYFDRSCIFFFEYHRHWSLDIYFTCPNLDRLSTSIRNLAEFEIHSIKKAFTIHNEFRYDFMNDRSKGAKPIGGKKLKPNLKIFALYKSFDGDEVTHNVRPLRKMLLLLAVLVVLVGFSIKTFMHFMTPDKPEVVTKPKKPATISQKLNQRLPQSQLQSEQGVSPARAAAAETVAVVKDQIVNFVMVNLGGFWVGNQVKAIDFFGTLIPINEFPYAITQDRVNFKINALIPMEVLSAVRPGGTWIDSRGVMKPDKILIDYRPELSPSLETMNPVKGG